MHVSDLAGTHVTAVRRLLDGTESLAVNLGTGRGFSVREVVDTVQQVTGLEVPHRITGRRRGDSAVLIADGSRAERLLGCFTARSDIETIVSTTHAWLAHRERYPGPTSTTVDSSQRP